MQTFPPHPASRADRPVALALRLMQAAVYLLPLVPVLYLTLWQDPALRFEAHLLHVAAIALATLEGAAITYVCWLCYQRSGELLVKRMTQGFMAFTVVYSLHGMLTPVASQHVMLFILFGPASRLLMGALLLHSVRAHALAVESPAQRGSLRFWWRFLGFLMVVNGAVAALSTSAAAQLPWPRMAMELAALLCHLLALACIRTTPARTPLMRCYMLALAWFAAASIAFLLADPWNHLWWLAHGIFAVGFSILGYGVLTAYLTTHALERVFSAEELFSDLTKVNARLVQVFREYEQTNSALQAKLLELDRSRLSFASLLAAVPDAVIIASDAGRILEANAAAEQLFGYTAAGLLGQPVDTLTPPDLQQAHARKMQHFELAPRTRAMGSDTAPLRCMRRDGSEFLAHISIGSLMFEGQQCMVTLTRAVSPQQEALARQRTQDLELIERGRLMDALLSMAPSLLFALQRNADGTYVCAVRSQACAQGLNVAHDATPHDWVRQWFNRVVPADLPQLISAIEAAALSNHVLQLHWQHHVPGRGTQPMQLHSGEPATQANGSQVWMCRVMPGT